MVAQWSGLLVKRSGFQASAPPSCRGWALEQSPSPFVLKERCNMANPARCTQSHNKVGYAKKRISLHSTVCVWQKLSISKISKNYTGKKKKKITKRTRQCESLCSDHLPGACLGRQPESGGPHGSPLCLPAGSSVLGHTPGSKKRHPIRDRQKEADMRNEKQNPLWSGLQNMTSLNSIQFDLYSSFYSIHSHKAD